MKSPAKPEPEVRAPVGDTEASTSASHELPVDSVKGAESGAGEPEPPANDARPQSPSEPAVTPATTPDPAPASASPSAAKPKKSKAKSRARSRAGLEPNNVRKLRQEAMMSKAESSTLATASGTMRS